MDAVNGGYYEVCTRLKGVKGWCWVVYNNPWLFSVAQNNKKKGVAWKRVGLDSGGEGGVLQCFILFYSSSYHGGFV